MKSLNVVAYAYQENINKIIGNLPSEVDRIYSDVVIGATDLMARGESGIRHNSFRTKPVNSAEIYSNARLDQFSSESQNKNFRCRMADTT
jgi:hypothetical protein